MSSIPKVANWPTMEDVCIGFDRQDGARPLRIRRIAWEVTVSGEQVANRWIYYSGGIWFNEDSSGKSIVAADEFTEDDFYGEDWTSLSVACYKNEVSCESISESYIEGYFVREETAEFQPLLDSPNATSCGDECALPDQPSSTYSPTPTGGYGGGTGGGGGGGGGGGVGGGGAGRVRSKRIKPPKKSAYLTFSNKNDDIPSCLELGEDSCGRLCDESAIENPYPYELTSIDITLTDTDNPTALWFVKVFFMGVMYANETMRNGDSVTVGINQSATLEWGKSHGIRASGWRANSPDIQASESVTMSEPCDPDPDCGEPCSGS